MSEISHGHPYVGTLVRDRANDRIGVFMGQAGPYAIVRPVDGGREWQAKPEDLQPEVSAYPRPADVVQLRAAYRLHLDECETCTTEMACDIGRMLRIACQAIGEEGERFDAASVVTYVPPDHPVKPCPFPCSICRKKGRQ